jgi:hypothetical protein
MMSRVSVGSELSSRMRACAFASASVTGSVIGAVDTYQVQGISVALDTSLSSFPSRGFRLDGVRLDGALYVVGDDGLGADPIQ